jgi:hypothetical protein
MPIQLDEPRAPGLPVVKRTAIGEKFVGAIVRFNSRDLIKNGAPALKSDGKPRQELVVTCVTLPGTTAPAGIGRDTPNHIPQPGELVRLILKGAAFGQWIEAKNSLGGPLEVGDLVAQVTEHAQRFDADGNPVGSKLTTNDELNAVPRGQSVGVYGTLAIKKGTDPAVTAQAEAAYHATEERIALGDPDAPTDAKATPATAPAAPAGDPFA